MALKLADVGLQFFPMVNKLKKVAKILAESGHLLKDLKPFVFILL